ncbi:hypothetical protein BDZ97DRAFT_1927446 [Flammula alnicola]|nr:hypothetical protein BDZ97DRAFT_1927446 [Flammula alnicola]
MPFLSRLHIKAVTLFVPLNLSSNSTVDFSPVPLEHISVGKSVHDFWQCYSGIGEFLSKIETFKVLISDHRDAGATNEILRQAAGSLGLLDVCYGRLDLFFIYRGKRIDLGLLSHLHTIRLRISDGVRQKLPHTTDVVRFLNYTTHPTSIETIDLFYSLTTTLSGIDLSYRPRRTWRRTPGVPFIPRHCKRNTLV